MRLVVIRCCFYMRAYYRQQRIMKPRNVKGCRLLVIALAAAIIFPGLLEAADSPNLAKYDRLHRELIALSREVGPLRDLSNEEKAAFAVRVRALREKVGQEIAEDTVVVNGVSRSRTDVRKEYMELRAARRESDRKRQVLDKLEVKETGVTFVGGEGEEPFARLAFKVENRGDFAVSRLRVRVRLVSEGRTVPWGEDEYTIRIRGGVEAGETRQLVDEVRGDLAFRPPSGVALKAEVVVVELFDALGVSVVGKDDFTEFERQSLASLDVQLEDLF